MLNFDEIHQIVAFIAGNLFDLVSSSGTYYIFNLQNETEIQIELRPVPIDGRYTHTNILYARMREISSIKIACVIARSYAYTIHI